MSNKIRDKIIREKTIEYKCANCGCTGEWFGEIISLQLHHKDGNHNNNKIENLEFLCPNCHAATDSYAKNKNTSINEKEVLRLIKEGKTIRQTLLEIGVSDGSANYTRVYQILDKNNIQYVNFSHNQHLIEKPNQPHYCLDCGKEISYHSIRCKECEFEYRKLTGEHTTRQVERPSKEELLKDIATSSFSAVGRKYGVSDNAIRKWCLAYGLPTHKKEIKELYTLIG